MKLISFTRGLLDNAGVKLIAFVVAMVIWFNASGQQEVKKTYSVALTFTNLPDSLTLTGQPPDAVTINVTGTRRELLLMGFRKINMTVSLAGTMPGIINQRLSVADMTLPPGIEPIDVRIVAPLSVELVLERIVERRMRVTVALSGNLLENQLLNTLPRATPQWVRVSGPKSVVEGLDRISTKPIDLAKVRASSIKEVDLDYDKQSFSCDPSRVAVEISIGTRGRRVLAHIPPTVLIDEENLQTEVTPKTVSVTLEGPQSLLDTLSSGDISVLLDLGGKPPGRYTLAPEIIVPDGVEKYAMDVDSLRVLISRASGDQSM